MGHKGYGLLGGESSQKGSREGIQWSILKYEANRTVGIILVMWLHENTEDDSKWVFSI
jgi:hypothetical protein